MMNGRANTRQLRLFRYRRCVYCGGPADSREHVPTKRVLEKPYPQNLVTVPSCRGCNNGFAQDEEYFLVALAQVGFVDTLTARVEEGGDADRTLLHSQGLEDLIIKSLTPGDDGGVHFTPDFARIHRVVAKTAVGLYFAHYGRYARQNEFHPVAVYHTLKLPAFLVAIVHTETFAPKRWTRIQRGVFEYIFVRDWTTKGRLLCIMNFHNTLWAAVGCASPRGQRLNYGRSRRGK